MKITKTKTAKAAFLGCLFASCIVLSSCDGDSTTVTDSNSSQNSESAITYLTVDKKSQVATPASVSMFANYPSSLRSVTDVSNNIVVQNQSSGYSYSTVVNSSQYYSTATVVFTLKNAGSSSVLINNLPVTVTNLQINGTNLSNSQTSIGWISQDQVNNAPYMNISQTFQGSDVILGVSSPDCAQDYCDWAKLPAGATKTITLNLSRNGPINSISVGEVKVDGSTPPPPVTESGILNFTVDSSSLKNLCPKDTCDIKVSIIPPSSQNPYEIDVDPYANPNDTINLNGLLVGNYSVVVDNNTYPDAKGGTISYTITPSAIQVNGNATTNAKLVFAYKEAVHTAALQIIAKNPNSKIFANGEKLLGKLIDESGTVKNFSINLGSNAVITGLNYGTYTVDLQGVADPLTGTYYNFSESNIDLNTMDTKVLNMDASQVSSSNLYTVSFNATNLPESQIVAFAEQNANYLYNQDALVNGNYSFIRSESPVAITIYQPDGYTVSYSPAVITSSVSTVNIDYSALQIGYLTTKNGSIVDTSGNVIKLKGINWFGFQGTGDQMVDGLYNSSDGISGDFIMHVKRLKALGFNAIRLPFGFDVLNADVLRSYTWNYCSLISDSQLQSTNLTNPSYLPPSGASIPTLSYIPTQTPNVCNAYLPNNSVMDRFIFVVNAFASNGFYVLLDDHLNGSGDYTLVKSGYDVWVNDWKNLAAKLSANLSESSQAMLMFDLLNEPDFQSIKWDKTSTINGNLIPNLSDIYTGAMDVIYPYFSHNLFFVEGAGQGGINANWGDGFATDKGLINQYGLSDPNGFFEVLAGKQYQNQVVISPHVYPPSVTNALSDYSGSGLYTRLNNSFGYLNKTGYCYNGTCHQYPIAIGEFGSKFTNSGDLLFLRDFASYMNNANDATDDKHNAVDNWFYWSWNPNSGDTGGILQDDWVTINWNKVDYLSNGTVNGVSSNNLNGLNLKPWYK